jgi:hypothetical protein
LVDQRYRRCGSPSPDDDRRHRDEGEDAEQPDDRVLRKAVDHALRVKGATGLGVREGRAFE